MYPVRHRGKEANVGMTHDIGGIWGLGYSYFQDPGKLIPRRVWGNSQRIYVPRKGLRRCAFERTICTSLSYNHICNAVHYILFRGISASTRIDRSGTQRQAQKLGPYCGSHCRERAQTWLVDLLLENMERYVGGKIKEKGVNAKTWRGKNKQTGPPRRVVVVCLQSLQHCHVELRIRTLHS